MSNYKVRVKNEAESKEVQELFFVLGGTWGGVKKIQVWGDIRQLCLQNGHITYSDDIDYFNNDQLEEITIQQLRDLAVLKRNDISDATHVNLVTGSKVLQQGDKNYYWQLGEWHLYQCGVDIKPIEKEMKMKEYLRKNQDGVYVLELSCEQEAQEPHANNWIEVPEGADVAAKSELNNRVVFYKDNGLFQFNEKWIQCGIEDSDGTTHNSLENFLAFGFGNKIVWNRYTQPKELPFIDDEPSLNDQYAEIEQVRQELKGIEATLAERQATYGSFEDVAFITENIMSILAKARASGLNDLPHTHRMALYMIASKMSRIVNGDFNHKDSWHDIGGYAKLVEDLL